MSAMSELDAIIRADIGRMIDEHGLQYVLTVLADWADQKSNRYGAFDPVKNDPSIYIKAIDRSRKYRRLSARIARIAVDCE